MRWQAFLQVGRFTALAFVLSGIQVFVNPIRVTAQENRDRRTAILIGFTDYANFPNVTASADDLDILAGTFREACAFDRVLVLNDTHPSHDDSEAFANVLRMAIEEEQAKRTRHLVIYLSGYGLRADDQAVYLALPNTSPTSVAATSFKISELVAWLESASSIQDVTIVLDVRKRSMAGTRLPGLDHPQILSALTIKRRMSILAAADAGQDSYLNEQGQSIFANAFSKAFEGQADQDESGIVELNELYRHLFQSVQEEAGKLGAPQVPMLKVFGGVQGTDEFAPYYERAGDVQVTLVNQAAESSGRLFYRVDGVPQEAIPAGKSRRISLRPTSRLEFYTGDTSLGDAGWRPLYTTPTNVLEFRTTRTLPPAKTIWTTGFTNVAGIQLTLIYPGSFMMGQTVSERQMLARLEPQAFTMNAQSETPRHAVEITKPFFLGSYEVTVAQFRAFVQQTQYRTDVEKEVAKPQTFINGAGDFVTQTGMHWMNPRMPQGDNHPVVLVTWNDAQRFCQWLTFQEGRKYGLPTEAQWEYAARAGSQSAYWNGNSPEQLTAIGNVRDRSLSNRFPTWRDTTASSDGFVFTSPVGSFPANPFGIHDVHGNVWEWCSDWYSDDYYATRPRQDPTGPSGGRYHVYRGGCFY